MSHEKRTKAIRDCIKLSTEKLVALQRSSELSNNECNKEVTRDIQKRQLLVFFHIIVNILQLRQFQTELLNEEVIQTSAFKVIYERCREHFRHPVFDKFRDYDLQLHLSFIQRFLVTYCLIDMFSNLYIFVLQSH